MSEILKAYTHQTTLEPYDPKIAEILTTRQAELLVKVHSLIETAGVLQLPFGSKGPETVKPGDSLTVQAFSSNGEWQFITVCELMGNRQPYIIEHLGDKEFRIVSIVVRHRVIHEQLLSLSNPFKAEVYRRLLAAGPDKSDYTADDFARDEFNKLDPKELETIIETYLQSQHDITLADQFYQTMSSPRTRHPNAGPVFKLY